jgi:starch synthase
MKYTVERALNGYKDKNGWNILVKRAMDCDNSWNTSAGSYIGLYKELCSN